LKYLKEFSFPPSLAVPAIGIVLVLLSSTNSSFSLQRFREEYRLSFGKKNHVVSCGGWGDEAL
jgi:hypothetical protein